MSDTVSLTLTKLPRDLVERLKRAAVAHGSPSAVVEALLQKHLPEFEDSKQSKDSKRS